MSGRPAWTSRRSRSLSGGSSRRPRLPTATSATPVPDAAGTPRRCLGGGEPATASARAPARHASGAHAVSEGRAGDAAGPARTPPRDGCRRLIGRRPAQRLLRTGPRGEACGSERPSPRSPVRTRTTSSTGVTQTLPSPIWPVARPRPGRRRRGRPRLVTSTSIRIFGTKSTCTPRHGRPRCGPLAAEALDLADGQTGHPDQLQRGLDVVELNGLTTAVTSFIRPSSYGLGTRLAGWCSRPPPAERAKSCRTRRADGVDAGDLVLVADPEADRLLDDDADDEVTTRRTPTANAPTTCRQSWSSPPP